MVALPRVVQVEPLFKLYQACTGILVEDTFIFPTIPSSESCTDVKPVVDVCIMTPPHVDVAA